MNNTISDGGWVSIGADRDPCASNIFEPFQYFMARERWVPLRRRSTALDDPHHAGLIAALLGNDGTAVSERHYNLATAMEAGRAYQQGLLALQARLRADENPHSDETVGLKRLCVI